LCTQFKRRRGGEDCVDTGGEDFLDIIYISMFSTIT